MSNHMEQPSNIPTITENIEQPNDDNNNNNNSDNGNNTSSEMATSLTTTITSSLTSSDSPCDDASTDGNVCSTGDADDTCDDDADTTVIAVTVNDHHITSPSSNAIQTITKTIDGINNGNNKSAIVTTTTTSPFKNRCQKTSKYRGVCWSRQRNMWRARIKVHGRLEHLGYFIDEDEAARAYDHRSFEANRENGALNFPENLSKLQETIKKIEEPVQYSEVRLTRKRVKAFKLVGDNAVSSLDEDDNSEEERAGEHNSVRYKFNDDKNGQCNPERKAKKQRKNSDIKESVGSTTKLSISASNINNNSRTNSSTEKNHEIKSPTPVLHMETSNYLSGSRISPQYSQIHHSNVLSHFPPPESLGLIANVPKYQQPLTLGASVVQFPQLYSQYQWKAMTNPATLMYPTEFKQPVMYQAPQNHFQFPMGVQRLSGYETAVMNQQMQLHGMAQAYFPVKYN